MNDFSRTALSTAIFSLLWSLTSEYLDLMTWAGFLGSTTYFCAPFSTKRSLLVSYLTVTSGVLYALLMAHLGNGLLHGVIPGALMTGILSWLMCMQALNRYLAFIPGAFIGASATFAGHGDSFTVLLSLYSGIAFGYAMKHGGGLFRTRRQQLPLKNNP